MTPSNERSAHGGVPARLSDGRAPAATTRSSPSTDIEADILAEARRSGVGEPVMIHIRPAVYARLLADSPSALAPEHRTPGAARIHIVVDEGIPAAPGYEIYRAAPRRTR